MLTAQSLLCSLGDPGIPHSFPTRRSSDLLPRPRQPFGRYIERDPRHTPRAAGARGAASRALRRQRLSQEAEGRSEEHTSELQSPCNLVCRLLLEKNKQIVTSTVNAETREN